MNYRSPQLLSLAKLAPHCFRCFAPNEGQPVTEDEARENV